VAVLNRLRSLALCALLLAPAFAAPAAGEYQVKAVFLYNFSRFVEWPRESFASANAPFIVGVFGHDPFGSELEEAVKGEAVDGRPLVVRRVQNAAEAAECQILFIHQSEDKRLSEAIAAVGGHSTLTVSDVPGAAQRGVMIRLVTEGGRIRMRIDADSVRAAHLTISSNLLRSAQIVNTSDSRDGS
jgi:hypothetical protein